MLRILYFFISLFFLMSCQKDSNVFIPDQTQDINKEVVFSNILGEKSVYTIPKLDGKYLSISNYLIKLDTNSLVDADGNTVNTNVRVTFNDARKDKLNLVHAKSVIVDDKPLSVIHYFDINISNSKGNLTIVKPVEIFILTNTDGTVNEDFYSYNEEEKVWKNGVDQNNIDFGHWDLENDESHVEYTAYRIMMNNSDTKSFCVAQSSPNSLVQKQLTCTLPDGFNQKNSLVYFINKDNTVAFPLTFDKTLQQFVSQKLYLNSGMTGDIVVFSDLGGEFYHFGTTNAVLAEDKVYHIPIKEESNEDIRAKMLAL